MPLYTSTGAFNVAVNDTTGTGRYSASGALRINLVTGSSYVGLYAADGALNVVDVSGVAVSAYGGLYHPSGAIRGRTAPTTLSGLQAPDGSYYFLGLFSPLNLFANGEQGAWYDPSDLDRYMSPVGSELVTNGDFSTPSDWTPSANTSVSGGVGRFTPPTANGNNITPAAALSLVAGKTYRVTFTVKNYVAGSVRPETSGGTTPAIGTSRNANGSYTEYLVAGAGDTRVRLRTTETTTNLEVDDLSVRELTAIDTATMYQDAAGTTPVTAVEQPVGLLLDKSKGLALGAELVTNGDGTNTTGWDVGAGLSALISESGEFKATANGGVNSTFSRLVTLVAGKSYLVSVVVRSPSTNSVTNLGRLRVEGGLLSNLASQVSTEDQNVTLSGIVLATGTSTRIYVGVQTLSVWGGSGDILYADNISVRELPGNHATQSTAASRPVLSARVNLLTFSEQFDNAAWTKDGCNITQNATTAPDGTLSADLLTGTVSPFRVRQGITSVNGVSYTASLHVQAGTASNIGIGIINVGGGGTFTFATKLWSGVSGSVTSTSYQELPNGWFLLKVTFLSNTTGAGVGWYVDGLTTAYIWGADLRVTNVGVNLPAYQRVAAATDYDTSGFPLYLKFDGVDDTLLGPSISNVISASDYEACIGARFITVTTNTSPWLNHSLITDAGGYVGVGAARSTGTVNAYNFDTAQDEASVAMTAPATIVLQQRHTGGEIAISTNGGAEGTAASGNTNPISNQMQIMKASGAVYTNGHIYGGIIRSTVFSNSERVAVRTWINNLTKAY